MTWQRFVPELIRRRLTGRKKVQASLFYASSSLISQLLRFVGVILSTRLIATEEFGLFAQASLGLSLAGLLREIGQNHALIGYNGTDRRYAVFNFQINALLGFVAALSSWLAFQWLPGISPHLRAAGPMIAVIVVLDGLAQTGVVMAQKTFRFRLVGGTAIACTLSWLAAIWIFCPRFGGLTGLLLAQAVESGLRLLILGSTVIWRYVGWVRGPDLRAYYFGKFAPVMIPQIALHTAAGKIDVILLSALSSLDQVGIYERMLQFIRIPWSLSINLIDQVLSASYSKEQSDPVALKKLVGKANRAVGIAVLAAAIATSFAYLFLLPHIVGPEWAHIIIRHWWVALPLTLLTPLSMGYQIFFLGTGQPKHLLATAAVKAVLDLFFGVMLVATYGAGGMLAAAAASTAAQLFYQSGAIRRYLDSHPLASVKAPVFRS